MILQFPVESLSMRGAAASDLTWATELMFDAGPGLFSYIFALKPERAKAALQQAFVIPNHAFSYEYTQVIEVNHQAVGLVLGYPAHVKRRVEARMQAVMANILPLNRVPRILVNLADMTRIKQDIAADAYYVLSLSIVPEFRGKGLGTALLKDTEAIARENNCRSVSMDVAYTNVPGKLWLMHSGYAVTCSKTSHRFQQMTDAGGLHRMERRLS